MKEFNPHVFINFSFSYAIRQTIDDVILWEIFVLKTDVFKQVIFEIMSFVYRMVYNPNKYIDFWHQKNLKFLDTCNKINVLYNLF